MVVQELKELVMRVSFKLVGGSRISVERFVIGLERGRYLSSQHSLKTFCLLFKRKIFFYVLSMCRHPAKLNYRG